MAPCCHRHSPVPRDAFSTICGVLVFPCKPSRTGVSLMSKVFLSTNAQPLRFSTFQRFTKSWGALPLTPAYLQYGSPSISHSPSGLPVTQHNVQVSRDLLFPPPPFIIHAFTCMCTHVCSCMSSQQFAVHSSTSSSWLAPTHLPKG